MKTLEELLDQAINWRELPASGTAEPGAWDWDAGDTGERLRNFVRYLRTRPRPHLGYTASYRAELRTLATPAELDAARARIEAAIKEPDILMPVHSNAIAARGSETLLLGLNEELGAALADRVMAFQDHWETGLWGVTHGIMEVIRCLILAEEVREEDVLPWLGWLVVRSEKEWEWVRRWSESTLGISGHNWWAHTFAGFYMAGLILPEVSGLAQFQSLLPNYLDRELGILFERDGWSKEGSPGYHEFATTAILKMAHLTRLNGRPLSERSQAMLGVIADTSWRMMAPDGDYPLFGDHIRQGGYKAFSGQKRPDRSPVTVLRCWAARFGLPKAKYVAESLSPEWTPPYSNFLPDGGENLLRRYEEMPAEAPESPDTTLTESGFYLMRENWTSRSDFMGLIAGILGRRTGHKNVDIFSFELYAKGRRILVDNGYGVVPEGKDNRARMDRISTKAHNTATVDGEDQTPILREFRYGAAIRPTVDDWRSERDFCYFSGVHDGYLHLAEPVAAVRRKVFYLRGKYWILMDRFTVMAHAAHSYQLHFHLNVPADLQDDGRVVTRGDGGNLMIVPVSGAKGDAAMTDHPYPLEGYENPRRLVYTRKTLGSDIFVTLLVPFEDGQMPRVDARLVDVTADGRTLTPFEGTGLEIECDGEKHFYFDQHMAWNLPWKGGGHESSARLFHSACQGLR